MICHARAPFNMLYSCQCSSLYNLIMIVYTTNLFYYAAVSGAPQSVQISNITSSIISLTWSPPLISERHRLTISGYIINCSTESNVGESALHYTDSLSATLSNLHPFTTYNCCVSVNSNHGRGKLACQSTVTWDQGT